jgi:hypothetical protein
MNLYVYVSLLFKVVASGGVARIVEGNGVHHDEPIVATSTQQLVQALIAALASGPSKVVRASLLSRVYIYICIFFKCIVYAHIYGKFFFFSVCG